MLDTRNAGSILIVSESSGEYLTREEIIMIDLGRVSEETKCPIADLTNDAGGENGFVQ